ncbi:chlorophyll A-B binding protein [Fragilaria crotonensis]|nr:chlorophyll A-B binding protein [Fragilaria crotonensis]
MKTAAVLALIGTAAAFAPAPVSKELSQLGETKADLQAMAAKLNPVIKFFDPLDLTQAAYWGQSEEFTIGWLRHSEIKHGRVAMAAFVGHVVQSNFHFPWAITSDGTPFPSIDLSPPEQWDSLPFASKVQIILFIGFLEYFSELTPGEGSEVGLVHYTKGGKPGAYPSFEGLPHPVPFNLFDPFGLSKNASAEKKERGLLCEINNGRLAMIGIMGFVSAETIPGSVPALVDIVKPYTGEVMAPFSADFVL